MPVYVYRNTFGFEVEEVFPMGEAPDVLDLPDGPWRRVFSASSFTFAGGRTAFKASDYGERPVADGGGVYRSEKEAYDGESRDADRLFRESGGVTEFVRDGPARVKRRAGSS